MHHAPIVESAFTRPIVWRSEDDTRRLAGALASNPAIVDAFIALHGELGAGKTTFVRHLLRALGVAGRIKSPTYAVVEPHGVPPNAAGGAHGGLAIWHFDFYRFTDPREWEDAGFRELFAARGLKLAEWPDNAGTLLPAPDLALTIHVQPDETRLVTLSAHTPTGAALLARVGEPDDAGEVAI